MLRADSDQTALGGWSAGDSYLNNGFADTREESLCVDNYTRSRSAFRWSLFACTTIAASYDPRPVLGKIMLADS